MLTKPQISSDLTAPHHITRSNVTVAVVGLIACLLGMWVSGRAGLSRLFSESAMQDFTPASADKAVGLSPSDPEAHYARGLVFLSAGQHLLVDAIKEFDKAVALRPDDYVLWLALGDARNRFGDSEGALMAFKEAARLAPYYALPHWSRGELLLRMGRHDEAFAELRRVGASQPSFLPKVIDLAWETYHGDARAVERAIQPQTTPARLALAYFFVKQGNWTEAVELFRATGDASDQNRRALLAELLAAKRFAEAYQVWSDGHDTTSGERPSGFAAITDDSFEGRITLNDGGFGWQLMRNLQAVQVSLDTNEPRDGASSLCVEFRGGDSSSSPAISQLVLVEPKARYRLSFAARAQKVVTGGLPIITVIDASSSDGRTLAQSAPVPQGTSGWRDYTVDFMTGDTTRAVLIALQRQNCTSSPCPIFGRVWFDSFSLQKISRSGSNR